MTDSRPSSSSVFAVETSDLENSRSTSTLATDRAPSQEIEERQSSSRAPLDKSH